MQPESSTTTPVFWDDAETAAAYLKAGFLGFPKSGKTFTSFLLACAVREFLGLQGPIAFFDTESGSDYLKADALKLTGKPLLVRKSRAFDHLLEFGRRVVSDAAVGIVDSITHPWREVCDAYLAEKNEALRKLQRLPKTRLEFQDMQAIKARWGRWTDFYLTAPAHLIVAGRAGWEWEMQENEEGKKELNKVGVKMKTETEFGFEPSLLVQMNADQELVDGAVTITRRAIVIGDRFHVLDAANATFGSTSDLFAAYSAVQKFFEPHLSLLRGGSHQPVDVGVHTSFGVDETGDSEWAREKKARTILCEEIQGELVAAFPGQSADEKKTKADILLEALGTRSWTAVENMPSEQLRRGLTQVGVAIAAKKNAFPAPESEPEKKGKKSSEKAA